VGEWCLFWNNEKTWRGLIARNPFFVHGKHGKLGKFCRVAALMDEPALPKFLRDKVGFTQLRRRHPTPEAWHHE